MSEHTPGPWLLEPDPGQDCAECGESSSERWAIGWRPKGGPFVVLAVVLADDREDANARLMRAAPDMYAELQRLRVTLDRWRAAGLDGVVPCDAIYVEELERIDELFARLRGETTTDANERTDR